jgi:hypothetical protein
MAKYGDLIRKARETDNQEDNKPDNQISVKPDELFTAVFDCVSYNLIV